MYARDLEIAKLEAQRIYLVKRLDLGLPKIQDGLAAGRDVSRWEEVWCGLLESYTETYDKLVAVQP